MGGKQRNELHTRPCRYTSHTLFDCCTYLRLLQIWQLYAGRLDDLAQPKNRTQAIACLNHLVADALGHVPDVFTYMSRLHDQAVFNFCAIPQVMAIATLELCYSNYNVFRRNVKIRKGQAVG